MTRPGLHSEEAVAEGLSSSSASGTRPMGHSGPLNSVPTKTQIEGALAGVRDPGFSPAPLSACFFVCQRPRGTMG